MSENTGNACACGAAPKLIFPCSGAADVGAVTDQAARALTREGTGRMYCLAGVGGHIQDMVLNVQGAGKILAIDGCAKDCAKATLAQAGFDNVAHLRLTDLGMQKGSSPTTDENIAKVVEFARPLLSS